MLDQVTALLLFVTVFKPVESETSVPELIAFNNNFELATVVGGEVLTVKLDVY